MKTYLKTLGRMFSHHITRFLSIIFIVFIAVGFSSGIGSSNTKIDRSLEDYYEGANMSDLIVKNEEGVFSEEDIAAVRALVEEEGYFAEISTGLSVDVNVKIGESDRLTRLYFLDDFSLESDDWAVNIPQITLEEGIVPAEDEFAALSLVSNTKIDGVSAGARVTLDFVDILRQLLGQQGMGEDEIDGMLSIIEMIYPDGLKEDIVVCGTLDSPLIFAADGEPSYTNGEDVEIPETGAGLGDLEIIQSALYFSSDIIPTVLSSFLGTGDIYISLADDEDVPALFAGGYEEVVDDLSAKIADLFVAEPEEGAEAEEAGAESTVRVISLYDNFSVFSLHSYSGKVEALGWVLVVAFIFVTALVVFSNISRLMEEERSQVACMRTLGYSPFKIIFKYALFAAVAAGIGGFVAYFVGAGVSIFVYEVFNYSYLMPPMSGYFDVAFFLVVFCIIVFTIMAATLVSGIKMMTVAPADLLRPKPPKAGKKVIFERMPWLWNLLSFKYKSTVRNVLRYKSRFLMTVIAVAFSMALVMGGLAILDLCTTGVINSVSIIGIAILIIAFAGLLTAVVIYTMTNINISERNRELATLMVLGYHDGEVSGYIYREVYIDTLIGVIFGYPLAALLIWVVFEMIGLGTLGGVSWYMWLAAPLLVALFTWIVTLLLRRKIVRVDMNESLKAIE